MSLLNQWKETTAAAIAACNQLQESGEEISYSKSRIDFTVFFNMGSRRQSMTFLLGFSSDIVKLNHFTARIKKGLVVNAN